MSDKDGKASPPGGPDNTSFDLDWDDALSDWEKDVEGRAKAASTPIDKPAAKPPAAPSRPLYQPPNAEEVAKMRRAKPVHIPVSTDDVDETVIGQTLRKPVSGRSTPVPERPATQPERATQRPSSGDIELDELLANLEDDTRLYPSASARAVSSMPARPMPPKPVPPPPGRAGAPRPAPPPLRPLLKPAAPPNAPPKAPPPATTPDKATTPPPVADVVEELTPAAALPVEQVKAALDDGFDLSFGSLHDDLLSAVPAAAPLKAAAATQASAPTPVPPAPAPALTAADDDGLDALFDDMESALAPKAAPRAVKAAEVATETATEAEPVDVLDAEPLDDASDIAIEAPSSADVHDRVTAPPAPAASEAVASEADIADVFELDAEPAASTESEASAAKAAVPSESAAISAPVDTSSAGVVSSAGQLSTPSSAGTIRTDRGAQAARRTLKARKPRREFFPLVGRQPAAAMARAEMLEEASRNAKLSPLERASALVAAAELRLRAGDAEGARAVALRSTDADESHVTAARTARLAALSNQDASAAKRALAREAANEKDAPESASFWATLSALGQGEGTEAAVAASQAWTAAQSLVSAAAVLASEAAEIEPVTAWLRARGDGFALSLVESAAWRALERGVVMDTGAPSASRALRQLAGAEGNQRDALWRVVAENSEGELHDAAVGLRLLESDTQTEAAASPGTRRLLALEGLRLRAVTAGDAVTEGNLSERLASSLSEGHRVALLSRAALIRSGASLHEAEAIVSGLAEASSGALSAVRARLVELDPERRAAEIQEQGALVVCARLAAETQGDATKASEERALLERAHAESPDATTRELALDAGLADPRVGSELAPTLAASLASDVALGELEGGNITRVRAFEGTSEARAKAWREEAASEAMDASFAWREAFRASLGEDNAAAADALAHARDVAGLDAAAFALAERDASAGNAARAYEAAAKQAADGEARATLLVRAAMAAVAAEESELARDLLTRASTDAAGDPVLALMRWRDAVGQGERPSLALADARAESSTASAREALLAHQHLVVGEVSTSAQASDASVASALIADAKARAEGVEEAAPTALSEASLGFLRRAERAFMRAETPALPSGLEASWPDVELELTRRMEPAERGVQARLAYAAALSQPLNPAFESSWLKSVAEAPTDLWLARRIASLTHRAQGEAAAGRAMLRVAELVAGPNERASLAATVDLLAPSTADLETIRAFHVAAAEHSLLAEHLGELERRAGSHAESAAAYERAARASHAPARRARLFMSAAEAHEEHGDDTRSVAALEEASRASVTYPGLFDKLREKLEHLNQSERLSDLVARRLAAGGDDVGAVELFLAQASLRETSGDAEGARAALRSALDLAPENANALKKLAQLSLRGEDYRGAAEALVRLAKARPELEELRWIFFELGKIYDAHIPDAKRAEAAYRRVLKLAPDDLLATEKLAALYRREGQLPAAIEQYEALLKGEIDPEQVRIHRLSLAAVHEQAGDARKAEQVLEATRRSGPTEVGTLLALREFYTRQNAQTALVMHLNRASQDFRHALTSDLTDEAAWTGLVEVLSWRPKQDAGQVAASAAVALGVVDVEVARLLDADGAATPRPDLIAISETEEIIAPTVLSSAARQALHLIGPYIDKAVGFDPRNYRAEKLSPKDPAATKLVSDVCGWLGLSEVEVWLAPTSPRVCLPFGSQHAAVLLGRDMMNLPEAERQFLLARSFFIAKAGLAGVLRATPQEVSAMLAYVAQQFDPAFQPIGLDPGQVQEQGRKLAKHAPRRVIEEAGAVVYEMVGAPEYDPTKLAMAASELGDRIGLLATGSVPAALNALLKLAGETSPSNDVAARVASTKRSPEAHSLIAFAISEAHFDARKRPAR